MKNKKALRRTAISALCVAFALSAASCGEGMITTNSAKDMEQVVGTVNITNYDEFQDGGPYAAYADAISERQFHHFEAGSGGVFPQYRLYLCEQLRLYVRADLQSPHGQPRQPQDHGAVCDGVLLRAGRRRGGRKIRGRVQRRRLYAGAVEEETAALDESLRVHYENHPELLTLQYFLTEGGTDSTDYDRAVYTLKSMINSTLDSAETEYIHTDDDSTSSSSDTRTTPTGVGTETEDYYPTDAEGNLDYDVYTGRNTLDSCGTYEAQDGSTQTTRRRAYNTFLSNLSLNNLLAEGEDTEYARKHRLLLCGARQPAGAGAHHQVQRRPQRRGECGAHERIRGGKI